MRARCAAYRYPFTRLGNVTATMIVYMRDSVGEGPDPPAHLSWVECKVYAACYRLPCHSEGAKRPWESPGRHRNSVQSAINPQFQACAIDFGACKAIDCAGRLPRHLSALARNDSGVGTVCCKNSLAPLNDYLQLFVSLRFSKIGNLLLFLYISTGLW